MPTPSTEIVPIYYEVDPVQIGYIKFLIESYECVGVIRTLDRQRAVIVLLVAPDFLVVARRILASISETCGGRELPVPEDVTGDWLVSSLADE